MDSDTTPKEIKRFKKLNMELWKVLNKFRMKNQEKLHTEHGTPSKEMMVLRKAIFDLDKINRKNYAKILRPITERIEK